MMLGTGECFIEKGGPRHWLGQGELLSIVFNDSMLR